LKGHDILFKLEDLQALTSYDLRFATSNAVGISPWNEYLQITLPRPRVPDKPVLYVDEILAVDPTEAFIVNNHSAIISWDASFCNGAVIDYYELTTVIVNLTADSSNNRSDASSNDVRNFVRKSKDRIQTDLPQTLILNDLPQDSFIQLKLRAHNKVGFSAPAFALLSNPNGDSLKLLKLLMKTFIILDRSYSEAVKQPESTPTVHQSYGSYTVITIILLVLIFFMIGDFMYFKIYNKSKDTFMFSLAELLTLLQVLFSIHSTVYRSLSERE